MFDPLDAVTGLLMGTAECALYRLRRIARRWREESQESLEGPGPARTPPEAGDGPRTGKRRTWWRRIFGG